MKTGNYENALIRFETRSGSPMLSDVIRGLIEMCIRDRNMALLGRHRIVAAFLFSKGMERDVF